MWTRYNHSMEDMYTLEGLKRAQEDLKRWEEKWANSDSNNPNKFRGNINEARSCVRLIESVLKTNGTLPLTEQEQLNKDLDAKFPNARSKENAKMANDAVDWLLHKNQDPRTPSG